MWFTSSSSMSKLWPKIFCISSPLVKTIFIVKLYSFLAISRKLYESWCQVQNQQQIGRVNKIIMGDCKMHQIWIIDYYMVDFHGHNFVNINVISWRCTKRGVPTSNLGYTYDYIHISHNKILLIENTMGHDLQNTKKYNLFICILALLFLDQIDLSC